MPGAAGCLFFPENKYFHFISAQKIEKDTS